MSEKTPASVTLAEFAKACRTQADQNYHLARLAALYVRQCLEAAPGRARRTAAIESLAEQWALHDEESLALPPAQVKRRLRDKVSRLLRCQAVVTLLGDGSQGGPKGKR